MAMITTKFFLLPMFGHVTKLKLNVFGRPALPGNDVESAAATTIVANGGMWTLGFK